MCSLFIQSRLTDAVTSDDILCGILAAFVIPALFFRKRSTGCLFTVTGTTALDVHMVRVTLVVGVVNTLYSFTVDADCRAWVRHRALERIPSLPLLQKALTAGTVTVISVLTSHHDVSFAAQMPVVVGTVIHCTF